MVVGGERANIPLTAFYLIAAYGMQWHVEWSHIRAVKNRIVKSHFDRRLGSALRLGSGTTGFRSKFGNRSQILRGVWGVLGGTGTASSLISSSGVTKARWGWSTNNDSDRVVWEYGCVCFVLISSLHQYVFRFSKVPTTYYLVSTVLNEEIPSLNHIIARLWPRSDFLLRLAWIIVG